MILFTDTQKIILVHFILSRIDKISAILNLQLQSETRQ